MPTAKSQASESLVVSEPEPEPADLRALRLLLRQSKDFRLAVALYNDPVRRDGWIRSLAEELGREGVRILTVDLLHAPDRECGLLERIQALVAGVPHSERFAIMVVNMETIVDYAPELSRPGGPGTAFLDSANLQRELFPKACPGPLVLWMTELLEQAFIRCAPDLWSWRNHVFDMRTRTVPPEPVFDAHGQQFRSDDERLHPETRVHRLEEELAAYRRIGSRKDEMRVLNAIGLARLDAGDAKLARLDFDAVFQIARETGDRHWEGSALGNLGGAHADLGDARKAIEYHKQALVISREIGDRRGEGADLGNLGNAHANLGDPRKAIEYHEQALVISRELGDRRAEGQDLGNLGNAHADLGDARKAIKCYEQQLIITREIGDRRGEGNALGNLGLANAALGDARKAIEYYEQYLSIAREIGDRRGEGNALGNLGNAHAALGDARKAIEFYEQQLTITREISDRRGEGNALHCLALAHDSLGNRAEAITRAEQAMAIYEAIEDPHATRVRAMLAEWRGQGDGAPKIG